MAQEKGGGGRGGGRAARRRSAATAGQLEEHRRWARCPPPRAWSTSSATGKAELCRERAAAKPESHLSVHLFVDTGSLISL